MSWHKEEKYKAHEELLNLVRSIEEDQHEIHEANLIFARMYDNREPEEINWSHQVGDRDHAILSHRRTNIVKSACDTVAANIGRQRPKATPVPKGGGFKLAREARKMDKFLYGMFQKLRLWEKGADVILDGAVFGTGCVKFFTVDSELKAERVSPDEIIVNQSECRNTREPRQLFHRKLVYRDMLLSTYGNDKKRGKEIRLALGNEDEGHYQYTSYRTPPKDRVVVVEGWRKPSYPGAGDGRHIIACKDITFLDEEWDGEFPFAFFRYGHHLSGFYGYSLAEEVLPDQIRLDEIDDVVREGQDLFCRPRVFVDAASGIVSAQIDNRIGRIIQYRGRKPEQEVWSGSNIEMYNERDRRTNAWMRRTGLSEMSVTSQLPGGVRLDSSRAIREFNSTEDRRLALVAQRAERFYLDCAERIIEFASEMKRSGSSVSVSYVGRGKGITKAESIDWSSIKAGRDEFELEIEASSIYNQSPAARIDLAKELAQAGVITPQEFRYLMNYGDEEGIMDAATAAEANIACLIGKLEEGEFVPPDPMQNLQLGINMVKLNYLNLLNKYEDVPEDVLDAHRLWVEQAVWVMSQTQPQPEQAEPAMGPVAAAAGPMGPAGPEGGMV